MTVQKSSMELIGRSDSDWAGEIGQHAKVLGDIIAMCGT